MGSETIIVLLLIGSALAGSAGFAAAWWTVSRRAKRLERALTGHFVSEDRLREMEDHLASLQVQIDKMQQDHQFLSRLLANRVAKKVKPATHREPQTTPV